MEHAIEALDQIAAVAATGGLSPDQLTQVVKVADSSDEHRWAAEAASWSPADLAHQARLKHTPTVEDAAARRAARELRFWWRRDQGMLDGRFSLPDIDGAAVESALTDLIARMRVGDSVVPVVLDVKTSKAIYDETALQLCAYARADFVGLDDGTEMPLLPDGGEIRLGVVVRPTPSGSYQKANFDLTDEVYAKFLACL